MNQRILLIVLALLAVGWGSTRAAEPAETERWFVVELQNQPAGWAVMRTAHTDDRITTAARVNLTVRRAGAAVEVEMGSTFVETADGKPISAELNQQMGAMTNTTRIAWTDDGPMLTTKQAGIERSRRLEGLGDDWLPPAAAERYVQQQLDAGRKRIQVRTIDPLSSLQPMDVELEVVGEEVIEVFGRTTPALKTRVRTSMLPGVEAVEYIDAEGELLKSTVELGFLQMTMVAADEKLAKARRPAPELLAQTLIRPDRPLRQPRDLRRASFVLRVGDGELGDLPDTAVQQVDRLGDRAVRVTVDLDAPRPTTDAAPELVHSSFADGTDPRIRRLAEQALRDADDEPAVRAEALRRFVHRFIRRKTLGVGMATASEVCRTREGDCTEHAVLLTALLRADGVPARTVSGLVYVSEAGILQARGVFGYHMWTQAWLGDRWVDLDASLHPARPFDATHIALAVSDLDAARWTNDLMEMIPLMGRLKIEVELP